MSDSKIIKSSFVSMSDIRRKIAKVDPDDPNIIMPHPGVDVADRLTEEIEAEEAIDDNVIDGSVSILLEEAESKATEIMKQAELAAEEIQSKAHTAGYEQGYADGKKVAEEELEQGRKALKNKAIELEEAYEEMLREAEPLMAEVISELVDNMVGHYADNQDVILFLVRLALGELSTYGEFIVKVSREDYDYVTQHKEELDVEVGDKVTLEIVKDSSLLGGDCLIETAYGSVDASLHVRRESLKQELRLIADSLRRREEV